MFKTIQQGVDHFVKSAQEYNEWVRAAELRYSHAESPFDWSEEDQFFFREEDVRLRGMVQALGLSPEEVKELDKGFFGELYYATDPNRHDCIDRGMIEHAWENNYLKAVIRRAGNCACCKRELMLTLANQS